MAISSSKSLNKILGCPDEDDQEINDIIAWNDKNKDGKISFDEFKRMMNVFIRRHSTIIPHRKKQ